MERCGVPFSCCKEDPNVSHENIKPESHLKLWKILSWSKQDDNRTLKYPLAPRRVFIVTMSRRGICALSSLKSEECKMQFPYLPVSLRDWVMTRNVTLVFIIHTDRYFDKWNSGQSYQNIWILVTALWARNYLLQTLIETYNEHCLPGEMFIVTGNLFICLLQSPFGRDRQCGYSTRDPAKVMHQ